jgi:hypothetical protein
VTHSNGIAPDGMSKADRDTIARLIRRNERVAKSSVKRLSAERLADIEAKLSAEFEAEDERWAAMIERAEVAVAAANEEIRGICVEEGVPASFAPSVALRWYPRGENAFGPRRGELRLLARARVAALEKTAVETVERASVAAETTLLAGGLTSDAARQALAEMPAAEALLPEVSVEELRALDARDRQPRAADAAASHAALLARFVER